MVLYQDFSPGDIGDEPVVIFGSGEIGRLTLHALTDAGVRVSGFCDPIRSRQGSVTDGVPVMSPADLEGFPPRSAVFDCGDYRRYARSTVQGTLARFDRLFVSATLLPGSVLGDVAGPLPPAERARRVALYVSECQDLLHPLENLRLKTLDVVVTEACSMRCVDCSNLMQYYAHPRHADVDELELTLGRVLAAVDGVDEFRVLGGEPFAYPRVGRVIQHLTDLPGGARVVVYTNATIVPRGLNLDALAHPRVMVDITDYGEHSRQLEKLQETLTARGVSWVSKTPTWTDSGRIGRVERSTEELGRVFRECCVNDVVTLLQGMLYLCPFSANAMNLGAIPDAEQDSIDLRADRSPAELRGLIEALYRRTTPLAACSFCRGRDSTSPEIVPAVQSRRPLPLTVLAAPR